jgi:hypothetical protein
MTEQSDEITIERAAQHVAGLIAECTSESDGGFKPGDPDYDGLHALAGLLGFCLGRERDIVPGEMVGLIALLGSSVVRSVAELDELKAEREQRTADEEQRRAAEELLGKAERFSIRITGDMPEPIHVGPYQFRFQADCAAAYFRGVGHHLSTFGWADVVPYDDSVPHRQGDFSPHKYALAEAIAADNAAGDDSFPTLYQRVIAQWGDRGRDEWIAASDLHDHTYA